MESHSDRSVRALIPWHSGTLYVVLASSLMGVMGVSLVSPVLPELRPIFGVSDAQIGLVVTAYTLPGVFLTPFIGLVADRIGRKRVLVPLLFTFGLAGMAIAFTTDFRVVLLLRFLQGIGASALITLAITLLGDVYDGRQLDALVGLNGSTTSFGAAFYPLLGGALAAVRWNVPFLFFGVGIVVGLFALVVLSEPTGADAMAVGEYLGRMRSVLGRPEALAIFGALVTAFFVFYGAVITAMPLLLSDEYGLSAGEIGPILAMVALASSIVASVYGRLANWRRGPELVALGFVAYGVGLLAVRFAPSVLLIGAALLVFGIGFGVVLPAIDSTIVNLVSEDLRAGMMGMRTSMIRLGQTLGPAGFTLGAETIFASTVRGYRLLILLAGIALSLAGGLIYLALRR